MFPKKLTNNICHYIATRYDSFQSAKRSAKEMELRLLTLQSRNCVFAEITKRVECNDMLFFNIKEGG